MLGLRRRKRNSTYRVAGKGERPHLLLFATGGSGELRPGPEANAASHTFTVANHSRNAASSAGDPANYARHAAHHASHAAADAGRPAVNASDTAEVASYAFAFTDRQALMMGFVTAMK